MSLVQLHFSLFFCSRVVLRSVIFMPRSRPLLEIPGTDRTIQITDDDSRTLIDPNTGIAFHSASGALAETRHVYLHNSGVEETLARGRAVSVLEIGLGTGLGMLLTVDDAVTGDAKLDYHALEMDLLPVEVLRELHLQAGLRCPAIWEMYLAWYDSVGVATACGSYQWEFNGSTSVTIHHQDARDFSFSDAVAFDAIYFDPFAPAVNQDLWTVEFLSSMRNLLRSGGHLVTYCVNRRVKDSLLACGFKIECLRGPVGGKRQVMRATRSD